MALTTFRDILGDFRAAYDNNRDLGTRFEKLIADYLSTDPEYTMMFPPENIWLWGEWSPRTTGDIGIDLVAHDATSGEYWAIQCKFYREDTFLDDIASFLAASGKQYVGRDGTITFARRVIFSTTEKWSSNAERLIENQTIPVTKITLQHLEDSPVDWSKFRRGQALVLKPKYDPREHQQKAIDAALDGFREADRGKLIMACGTGKTFTALRLAEEMGVRSILFLAPSISLVSQTLREWTAQAREPLHAIVVCSDQKADKDDDDIRITDVPYPVTTDARRIADNARAIMEMAGHTRLVVFSTYQSISAVGAAQQSGLTEFDLIICDEAHRTTGITLFEDKKTSEFNKVHHNAYVRARKRLYMTATPRIFTEATKTRAKERQAVVYAMDDEALYGKEFHRLSFGEAVALGQLSDYKVLIVAVREEEMAKLANQYNDKIVRTEEKTIDIDFAKKIIGSWKGLSKLGLVVVDEAGEQEALTEDTAPMRRAVAFCRSIRASRGTCDTFTDLVSFYLKEQGVEAGKSGMVECKLQHVDGGMNALVRHNRLEWLKGKKGGEIAEGQCRILTNARCLSEGVDVPALDAVIFFDTRESIVDVVQSVGRVMRKAEGKQYGYIILPVCIPDERLSQFDSYIDSNEQFKGVWKVIKALRAHDERLVDESEFRRRVKVTGENGKDAKSGKDGGEEGGGQIDIGLDFSSLPLADMNEAVYAAIPKKLGDREYWAQWAKDIAGIAGKLIVRIEDLLRENVAMATEFDVFVKGLRDSLNPSVSYGEAVEMLAQHILTLPVFQALFVDAGFPKSNAVGRALQRITRKLDAAALDSETEGLQKFYDSVRERIGLAKSDKSRQEIIRNLYDTFFQNAFPRMAERLGIVYTPVEVVDFILHSAQHALRVHFGARLSDEGVHILDPFAGTGTFPVRLIQSGLIRPKALARKYGEELHANEIVLLAYYIASINIETAFHAATGDYQPFEGMVLTDTFQITEAGDLVDRVVLPENNAKIERQKAAPIRVIVGNPPYSVGQESANDNNQNLGYPTLDASIRRTYALHSSAINKNSLYDSYIRAIRWATDRIDERGVIAFVTNGAFIDSNTADGLRKCLTREFSHLYVFNLRGNQRTAGEESRREGGKIFGSGSRTPVAVTVMVKDPAHQGECELRYHDIGDYLSQKEKLEKIAAFGSIGGMDWQRITPNEAGDWINQRDPAFEEFIAIGDRENSQAIFSVYSNGLKTQRDAWAYNMSRDVLAENMRRMIDTYNEEREEYAVRCEGLKKDQWPDVESVIDANPRRISWSHALKADAGKNKAHAFEEASLAPALYRPFNKQWLYFNRHFNERGYQIPKLFPTPGHQNIVITVNAKYSGNGNIALTGSSLPDLHVNGDAQCFPLYWYEKPDDPPPARTDRQSGLFSDAEDGAAETGPDDGYIRHETITDWALNAFRSQYDDETLQKEDIFWYVYGILHSSEYKARFAADLKKMLPRIPFARDFWVFSHTGRALGELHLDYETVPPWPSIREETHNELPLDEAAFYHVTKMAFSKNRGADGKSVPDKSRIRYNGNLTLSGIPLKAYEYVVNGKSAIEWLMDRYQITTDKASGITNDPNAWSDNPRYIVDLVKRLVTVSVESVKLIAALPALEEIETGTTVVRVMPSGRSGQ
ncbi:MAG: DEAD/DEAH box helicase family protein [Zoogloeaceae bacterium]|jgi:predicted helicase|nr:DEAD/DEAH box helicase family protein [Zoogloeaceae bacterium]